MAVKKKPKRTVRGAEKKAETIKRRIERDKQRILQVLEEASNIGQALARVGIDRSTYYRWRHEDSAFQSESSRAMQRGIEKTADMVEMSLLGKARDGNVYAQKIYLENNHPRYKRHRAPEEFEDGKLSEERQKQIAEALEKWHRVDSANDDRYIQKR